MEESRFKKPVSFRQQNLLNVTRQAPRNNDSRTNVIPSQSGCSTLRANGNRKKVPLKPGHSALDWYELSVTKGKKFGLVDIDKLLALDLDDLKSINYPQTISQIERKVPLYLIRPPLKISKELLQRHNTRDDCWCVIKGRVYCLTNYLDFHPGGVDILLQYCAGKDATVMFNKYHRWVSYDKVLETCFIGLYVE